jgi:hypothetical protein
LLASASVSASCSDVSVEHGECALRIYKDLILRLVCDPDMPAPEDLVVLILCCNNRITLQAACKEGNPVIFKADT